MYSTTPPRTTRVLITGAIVLVLLLAFSAAEPLSETGPAEAVAAWLSTLEPEQREATQKPLRSDDRLDWHYVPRSRDGLALGDHTRTQRRRAMDVVASVLSPAGVEKVEGVIALERVLYERSGRSSFRDPGKYFVSVFGVPTGSDPWAWRLEGHHLSLNVTAADSSVSVTPFFLGANPSRVNEGVHAGLRVLGAEEDLGRRLVKSLTTDQRRAAIVSTTAPRDIILGPGRRAKPLEPAGLRAGAMSSDQRILLMRLVEEYLNNIGVTAASEIRARIDSVGRDRLAFAWAGDDRPGRAHYYRIQSPAIIIEYDNVQGGATHIHSVLRDPVNDFGEDLLLRHRREHLH